MAEDAVNVVDVMELLGHEAQRDWFSHPVPSGWAPVESLIDSPHVRPVGHSVHGTVGATSK